MYAHQHAAVSVGATFTVAWAAGVAPPWSVVGWTVLGGTLIDVIDHPLYQLTYGRRQGVLAGAWQTARRDGLRRGLAMVRQAEDSRTFDRLFLHNVNGLIASLVVSLVIAFTWRIPGLCAVAFGWLLHMLSDITWDFKNVGHARNWFCRGRMPWRPGGRESAALARNWYLVWGLIIAAVGVVGLQLAVALRTAAHLPGVGGLGYVTALMVLLITGMLAGLATAVWRHSVSMRAATGARPALAIRWPLPEQPGWAAARRLTAARIFRHDYLILAGCLAVTMSGVLIIWTWLQPGLFLHPHQVPTIVLAVPLGLMICTGVFGHTSAAAVGGLLGVVLSVLGDRLLSHAGLIHVWATPTAFGIVASGLAAWVFSLLLGRFSGRIRASSTLVAVTPAAESPGSTLSPGLDEPAGLGIEELNTAFRRACEQALGYQLSWAAPTWPQADDADHWGVTPDRDVLVFTDRVRIRLRASHSPRAAEDDAVFHPTFFRPGSESPVPLMPRSWAGASAPHAQVESGKLSWVGSYGGPVLGTVRPDGTTLHKTLSEITDNLLTRQSDLIVDVCRIRDDRGSLFAVISREQTSTKTYGTPEAEHVGLQVADYVASRTSGRVTAARIFSTAHSGEHPLGFAGGWTPAIAAAGQESELARAATPFSQDFQTQTSRLVAQRLLFAVIQIAGLLPLIQLIAKP